MADEESGHFVTIDGHAVFISGPGPGKTAASRKKFHEGLAKHHAEKAAEAKSEGDTDMAAHHKAMSQGHAAAARGDKAGMTKASKKLGMKELSAETAGKEAAMMFLSTLKL